MPDSDSSQWEAAELRRRAEAQWQQQPAPAGGPAPADTARLLHELEVHQIELEMQNAELRRAQEELAVSHARYFDLFDLAPVGYLTLDARGLIVEANLAAAALLGVERRRLVGQPLTRFIHRDDQDVYYLYHKRLASAQGAEACELRLQRRDAGLCWVRLHSVLVQDREREGVQTSRVTLSDITERKQAEEQMRFQAGLLQAVDQAVIVGDLDMVVMYWNRYAEKLYGWSVQEAVGHGLRELFMRQVPAEQTSALVSSLQVGRAWSGEMEVTRKNGEAFSASFEFSPVQDPQGKLVGAVSVSRDTTQRSLAEADLRLSSEQLHNLSRHLVAAQEGERQFIAEHLYDNEGQRLAALLIGLGNVEREVQGDAAVRERIVELKQLVDGLMRDLHGLAMNLRPASLDRLGLAAGLRQYTEELARRHSLEMTVELRMLRKVHLSREAETGLYRIVQEALTNAVRHARASQVSVTATRREDHLVIMVEDDGEGFEVNGVIGYDHMGLLGMRERAAMLGGNLTIESTPGKGTSVFIDVPIHAP